MSFKVKNIYPYEIADFSVIFYLGYSSEDKPEEELDRLFIAEIEMLEFDKNDFAYNSKNDTYSLIKSKEVIKLFKRFSAKKEKDSQTKNIFFTKLKGIEIQNNNVQAVEYKRQKDYIEKLDLKLFASKINDKLKEVVKQAIAHNAISLLSENYLIIRPSKEEARHFYYVFKVTLFFTREEEVF